MKNEKQELEYAFGLHRLGRLDEAAHVYERLIGKNPHHAEALHYLGTIKATRGELADGRALIERSLSNARGNVAFLENYVGVLFQIKDYAKAVDESSTALEIDSRNRTFLYVKAVSLLKQKKLSEALVAFDALLRLYPNDVIALNEKASVLGELEKYQEALSYTDRAISIEPRYAEAFLNKGHLSAKLKRYEEALSAYNRARSLNPNLAETYAGLGHVFREIKRFDDALSAYDLALARGANAGPVWLGIGTTLFDLKRHPEALAAYGKAAELIPGSGRAWYGIGNVFYDLQKYDEALKAYKKTVELEPNYPNAEGDRLFVKMRCCDWAGIDKEFADLAASDNFQALSTPFVLLAIPSSSHDQFRCARFFSSRHFTSVASAERAPSLKHDRIRLAYVSSDFGTHPTSFLIAGLIEAHHSESFDVTGVSLQPEDPSEIGQRMKRAFGRFIDASGKSDAQITQLMRELEIDIAIDLNGYTKNARSTIFANRAAPVQVNYLGFPGTMGAECIDYLIADRTLIPEASQPYYQEKIVYLPNSYQANDATRAVSEKAFTRSECNLPAGQFVFCCFNSAYKILPDVFDSWMRILGQVDGSVLWLLEENETAVENLKREAEKRGVSAERLVFAPRMLPADHLARHRVADLFLDTLPYNAHTTASDALWAGLPVLTQMGETFAGRVAASLLNAIALPELITTSPQAYEKLAIELAANRERLLAIKSKLANNRLTTPLFNTRQFTTHIEAAYAAMYERYQSGLPPDTIYVPR